MIIDTHTHIFPDTVIQRRSEYCIQDKGFCSIYSNEKARMINIEGLLDVMDKNLIDISIICGFPWQDDDINKMCNDYLLESSEKYKGRFIPFITVDVHNVDKAIDEFERCLRGGARGVGEVAFYSKRRLPTQKHFTAIMDTLRKYDLPFLLHTNEPIGHQYPGKAVLKLKEIYDFVLGFQDVKIILGHWGGGIFFYELMPEVRDSFRNVFYDTAASPFLYEKEIYRIARDIVGIQKILFGSDYPLIKPSRYIKQLHESGLTQDEIDKILGIVI